MGDNYEQESEIARDQDTSAAVPSAEAIPVPVWTQDGEGALLWANSAWKLAFGYANSVGEALHPDEFERWKQLVTNGTKTGRSWEAQFHVLSSAKVLRFILILAPAGPSQPGVWIGSARELETVLAKVESRFLSQYEALAAENAQTEVALRLSGQQFRSFFEHGAGGKALVGLGGEILAVNPAFCQMFGYSETELLGMSPRDLRHPEDNDRMEDIYRGMLSGERGAANELVRFIGGDGRTMWMAASIALVKDSLGHPLYFTASLQDVSALKAAEEDLRQKTVTLEAVNSELSRSNADLERFAYVASHDLQEPLRKIRIFGTRLVSGGDEMPPGLRDYATRMMHAAERMQKLIEDLLGFSRLRNRPLEASLVSLDTVLADVLGDLESAIEENGVQVSVDTLPQVWADKGRMRQLLLNLLSNALKFQRPGVTPEISVRCRFGNSLSVSSRNSGNSHLEKCQDGDDTFGDAVPAGHTACRIWIEDNGTGFDPSEAERLFEVFSRLHTRQEYPGNGIGLAICRRVVEEHGGRIEARGRPGEGATFVVTLPLPTSNAGVPQGAAGALGV